MDIAQTNRHATTLVASGSACLVAALAMLQHSPVLGYVFVAACVGLNVWGACLFGTSIRAQRQAGTAPQARPAGPVDPESASRTVDGDE